MSYLFSKTLVQNKKQKLISKDCSIDDFKALINAKKNMICQTRKSIAAIKATLSKLQAENHERKNKSELLKANIQKLTKDKQELLNTYNLIKFSIASFKLSNEDFCYLRCTSHNMESALKMIESIEYLSPEEGLELKKAYISYCEECQKLDNQVTQAYQDLLNVAKQLNQKKINLQFETVVYKHTEANIAQITQELKSSEESILESEEIIDLYGRHLEVLELSSEEMSQASSQEASPENSHSAPQKISQNPNF